MGGTSSEHEISLRSGTTIARGLQQAGYNVRSVVLAEDRLPELPGIEAVFIALHGRFGEDGGIQQLLEERGLPFTGADSRSSRLAFDKLLTRATLAPAGLPLAAGQALGATESAAAIRLPCPLVVKPPREGSSVGITIVKDPTGLEDAIAEGRRHDRELLIEEFVPGREWTVGIVDDEALPPIEIQAAMDGGWYSWNAKYFSQGTTQYIFAEDNPDDVALSLQCRRLALEVFRTLGARGFGRVDFRIDPTGKPFVLELNTIPGFTEFSLLPMAAARAGMPLPALCQRIMETAAC